MKIKINRPSKSKFDIVFGKFEKRILDFSGAWQGVSDVLTATFTEMFAGGADGAFHKWPAWAPHAPATIRWRGQKGWVPLQIGWQTGAMATTLINPHSGQGGYEIREKDRLVRGTHLSDVYVSVFENGAPRRWGYQPRRPIADRILQDKQVAKEIAKALNAHFKGLGADK